MFGTVCPQCKKSSDDTTHRLVRDSCGHQKCRVCLLIDEEKCKQCAETFEDNKTSVIKYENNHESVITCSNQVREVNGKTAVNGLKSTTKKEIKKNGTVFANRARKNQNDETKKTGRLRFSEHIKLISNNPCKYKCNVCNKEFNTRYYIKFHLYCSGLMKPFACDVCSKEFITKTNLEIHKLKHSGVKPYVCSLCNQSFWEKGKLNRHSTMHTSSKPFICAECGKAFRTKESLNVHKNIHKDVKPYACDICQNRFNNTSNLKKHLVTHSKEKAHMCDQCGKRLKTKWALNVHRRSHSRLRPFECSSCNKAFVHNKDLQRHLLTHLETKPYKCSICTTAFRRKDNLNRHMKNTHPGQKVEPLQCKTVKELLVKPTKPVDKPNAIHVITASPACNKSKSETPSLPNDHKRSGSVINVPLKLAFKTTAFKSHYNIHRNINDESIRTIAKPYDLAESVNICQKILSPHIPTVNGPSVNDPTSSEICQKILSPYPTRSLHYETSFEHKKHAIIKNIKFKLPSNYTNLKENDTLKEVMPLKSIVENTVTAQESARSDSNVELKKVETSVIVNTNNNSSQSNLHWRRRTLQNLNSKSLEN